MPPLGWPRAAPLRSLEAAVEGLIEERRSAARQERDPGPDLLDLLLSSFERRRVRDELVTFLAAGYETTSTALSWALALLASHPEVAARLRAEVLALAGGEPSLGPQHLGALVQCEQVVKETLRLWPPVHTLGRQVRREVTLMGYTLPPGTIVTFSTYLLHRRPELYPEPERFLPERFARAPEAGPGRFSYLPFGAGPRACIGGEIAMSALKLLVAGIIARHDLRLEAGSPIVPRAAGQPAASLAPSVPVPPPPVIPRAASNEGTRAASAG